MYKIDRPLAFARPMCFAQLICAAKDIRPFNRRVNQNTIAQIFIDLLKCETKLRYRHVAARRHIPQGVAHFGAMKRRKEEWKMRFGEERARHRPMSISMMQRDEK
jgi:hypothetical protein